MELSDVDVYLVCVSGVDVYLSVYGYGAYQVRGCVFG